MSLYLGTTPVANTGYNKANTDLSNLASTGKNIANWSSSVTNCITEIPQDIKLELNDGTLTLKAGSKVYVPNGSGVFDAFTLTSDVSRSDFGSLNGKFFIGLRLYNSRTGLSLGSYAESTTTSGTTPPSGSGLFYNTSTNKISYYLNGAAESYECSFNLALVTFASGTITSIDQVFNGFGYIGSTVFALPGVKGLIPNGRNEDGTLKNIEFTVSNVLTHQAVQQANFSGSIQLSETILAEVESGHYFEQDVEPTGVTGWTVWFNTQDNIPYLKEIGNSSSQWTPQYLLNNKASYHSDATGKILSFNKKTVFHAVDYNDFINNIPHIVETYVNGTSWYRVYSDGWCEQGGANNSGDIGGWQTVYFIKPYSNTNYYISVVEVNSTYRSFNIDGTHNDYFRYEAISVVGNKIRWYACGYIS